MLWEGTVATFRGGVHSQRREGRTSWGGRAALCRTDRPLGTEPGRGPGAWPQRSQDHPIGGGAEAGRTWGVTRAGGPVCVAAGVPRGRFREPRLDEAEGRLRATGPWSRQSGGLSAAGFGESGISREKMPGPRHRLTRSRARSVGDAGKGALSLPDGFWGGSGRRGPPPPERGGKAAQGLGDERTTSAPASARSPEDRPVPRQVLSSQASV